MSSRPATPVRLPKAAGSYAPSIVDPELRSEINSLLLQGGHIIKIQETLLHALQLSPTNWPSVIQTHALSLLRSGEIHTFPDLMARVLEDIKSDTQSLQSNNAQQGGGKGKLNGTGGSGTGGSGTGGGSGGKGRGEDGQSLALPASVVEEGVRVTKECLEVVCEFQP